jgi:hypothetical protein
MANSKARILANLMSAGNTFADNTIDVSDINGVTATTTEINYLDGVTSNIQSQFDGLITDLVSDTTPQLGGNLDLNSNDITGTGNVNITGTVTATSFSGDGSSLTGISTYDVNTDSTGFFDLPTGSSAQRPASPSVGNIRVNSSADLLEVYTSSGWKQLGMPPTISNFTGGINEDTDTVITVNGTDFTEGSVVKISGAATNGSTRSLVTTFVNSTQLTASTNATALNYVGGETFDLTVVTATGLSTTLGSAGTVDRDPIWVTSAGNLATLGDRDANASIQLSATDPDSDSVTYSVTSGSLPGGLSLSSSGLISGNQADVAGSTTYPFTITASSTSSGGVTTSIPREFSIIITRSIGTDPDRAFASPSAIPLDYNGPAYIVSKSGVTVKTEIATGGWVQVSKRTTNVGNYGWTSFKSEAANVEYSDNNAEYSSRLRWDMDFNYIRIQTQSHDTNYYNATTRSNLPYVRNVTYMKTTTGPEAALNTGNIPNTTWDNKGTYYTDRIWVGYSNARSYLLSPNQNNNDNSGGYFKFNDAYGQTDALAPAMSTAPQYFNLWLK